MNFQRISPNISDTGNPSKDMLSTDNSNLFQLRQTDSKLEDSRSSKNPIVRSLLQRLTVGNESVWIRIGSLRESIGDFAGAMEAYNNALRFSSNSPTPLCKLGSILLRKGHLEQALVYIQQALTVGNNSGEAWSLMGYYYLKTGAYEQAYEAFQNAIRLLGEQSSAFLWYGIGLLYELNGSTDYALEAYQNALKLKPLSEQIVDIYLHVAHIYEEREALDVASDYLNKAFLHVSSFNNHTGLLGEVYFRMGAIQELKRNIATAKEFYLKALKENPNHAKSLQQLGWIEHEEGRSDEGFRILKRAVESDPNDGQGWYLLGRLHMAKKEFRSAYDSYQHAVYCNSRNPRFWCSIGVLYYQMGQYRDAMDAYTRAIRLNPNLSEVWYDLGTLYESFSQYKDALDAYKKALELSPNNAQIKARVLEIERNMKEEHVGSSPRDAVWNIENGSSRVSVLETKESGENVVCETLPKVSNARDGTCEALESSSGEAWRPDNPIDMYLHENVEKHIETSEQVEEDPNRENTESRDREELDDESWKKDNEDGTTRSATASSSFSEETESVSQKEDKPIENSQVECEKPEQVLTTSPERHESGDEKTEHVVKRQRTSQAQSCSSESFEEEEGETFPSQEQSSTLEHDAKLDTPKEVYDGNPLEGSL